MLHPRIRGFEFRPGGKLLTQKVDFDGPVGIAYERGMAYSKPWHSHDRVTITFPRGSSRSSITPAPGGTPHGIDRTSVHVMAKDQVHSQASVTAVYDTFALFVKEDHYAKYLRDLGVARPDIRAFLGATRVLPRTAILDEAIQRYFLHRVLQGGSTRAPEARHLESVLLSEVFFASRRDPAKGGDLSYDGDETALLRAIELIESRLFEPITVAELTAASRASQATLFRLFKREVGVSPIAFIRNRRLDEARLLLRSGEYRVNDVCLLVGYEDQASFSKAFRRRFGSPPSRMREKKGATLSDGPFDKPR